MKSFRKLLLILLWLLLVLAGYYYVHKPFSLQQILSLFLAGRDLALALLVLATCGGLGHRLLPLPGDHPLMAFSLQAALGAGIYSLVWLGLGLAGLFRGWVALLLLLASLVFLWRPIRAWAWQLSAWVSLWASAGWPGRLFLLAASLLALNQLWIALAPPVKYDALTYHLALPATYAAQGTLRPLLDNPYSGHPQLAEMLNTWLALFGLPAAGAALTWLAGIVFFCGLAGFTAEYQPGEPSSGERATAAGAALLFVLAGATARWMLGWAYTDLYSAWMGLAVLAFALRWHRLGLPGDLWRAGVFVGLAVSTKYTAGIIALALYLGLWIVPGVRRPSWKTWLVSGALALGVFLPWALKNLAFTGNPFFPYFFPTAGYSAERLASANPANPGYHLLSQLILPLYVTWAGVDSAAGPATDLGPLLVLFALPALWALRKDAGVRLLACALLLGWLAMAIGGRLTSYLTQTRLFYVLLPGLAALAGWGWVQISAIRAHGVRLGRLAGVAVGLVVVLAWLQDANHLLQSEAIPTVLGLQSEQGYLEQNTGAYIHAMNALNELPSSDHILMLWETRGYYGPANAVPDLWIDRFRSDLRRLGSPEAVLADWQSRGYTKILLSVSGVNFVREEDASLTPAEWRQWDKLLRLLPDPLLMAEGYYLLYDIPPV